MLLRRRAPSYGAARALCRWMAAKGRRRFWPGQVQVGRGFRRLGSQGVVCSAARIVAEKRSGSRRAARSSNGIEFGAAWRVGGAAASSDGIESAEAKRRMRDARHAIGIGIDAPAANVCPRAHCMLICVLQRDRGAF